jgi:hypothetical protein
MQPNQAPNFKVVIEKDEFDFEIFDAMKDNQEKSNDIPIEKCLQKFDDNTFLIVNSDNSEKNKKIKNLVRNNLDKTPEKERNYYKNQVINILSGLKKSKKAATLPKLPYGQSLSDDEFISLLEKCVEYSNYHLKKETIEEMKKKLTEYYSYVINDIFSEIKIKKDIIQNALLTILTTDNNKDQQDNYDLLSMTKISSIPLIQMEFDKDGKYKLDINELKETFCSPIYLENYQKTLKDFIPEANKRNVTFDELKEHITNYFDNHLIYFSDLPKETMAITCHTGNIYLTSAYLYEYYNDKGPNSKLIIREKIILNIGHELAHVLLREISKTMNENFFITSNNKNKDIKNNSIPFKAKFINKIHPFNGNESGNMFDYNFFNNYYFESILPKEAEFFLNIKTYQTIESYQNELDKIIAEEKKSNLTEEPVNKFKKKIGQHIRWCIKSRLFESMEE